MDMIVIVDRIVPAPGIRLRGRSLTRLHLKKLKIKPRPKNKSENNKLEVKYKFYIDDNKFGAIVSLIFQLCHFKYILYFCTT